MEEIIKIHSNRYDWNKILKHKLIPITFDLLEIGDIVISKTFTYSQKYMLDEFYDEYNMEKIGILLTKDKEYPNKSKLYRIINKESNEYEQCDLYADAGSSGGFYLFKINL